MEVKSDLKRRDFLKTGAAGAAGAAVPSCAGRSAEETVPHRHIAQDRCLGCGQCQSLCPMGAIRLAEQAAIDPDECAECGVCWRSRVCPADAIRPGRLTWPRTLRETFSNPLTEHKSTGVAGRGSECIKTNDSMDRFAPGFMGVIVELGRPALGARLADVEAVVKKFAAHGYEVLADNPVAELVADKTTGALRPEVLNEKVISALVEFLMPDTAVAELMAMAAELGGEVKTVFNLSVALRARPDGSSPAAGLFGPGQFRLPNGKVNLGLAAGIVKGEK